MTLDKGLVLIIDRKKDNAYPHGEWLVGAAGVRYAGFYVNCSALEPIVNWPIVLFVNLTINILLI